MEQRLRFMAAEAVSTQSGFIIAAGLALSVLLALWWLVRHLQRQTQCVAATPDLWTDRDYCCPACGQPMQPGWLLLGKGAIWTERNQRPPSTFAHLGQALPNTISLDWRPASNMSWRCHSCQLLLVDHAKMIRPAASRRLS